MRRGLADGTDHPGIHRALRSGAGEGGLAYFANTRGSGSRTRK